jgi:hypothetical protein
MSMDLCAVLPRNTWGLRASYKDSLYRDDEPLPEKLNN